MAETKTETPTRALRKTFDGVVISDKMNRTITVVVERLEMHAKYKKFIRRKTKLKAHDENSEARIGDLVRITETRPLSKTKRWRLVRVLRKAD